MHQGFPGPAKVELKMQAPLKLNHAAPSFVPKAYFKPEQKSAQAPKKSQATPQVSPFGESMAASLDSFTLNNNFTPSTPHVHKFRTEMCKNFELYGKCKYGDEVSIPKIVKRSKFSNLSYIFGLLKSSDFKYSGLFSNKIVNYVLFEFTHLGHFS